MITKLELEKIGMHGNALVEVKKKKNESLKSS